MTWMNRNARQRIKSAVLSTLQIYAKPLSLPIPIKSITKSFENIRLIPYSRQMQRYRLSYEEMLNFTGTDDACTDYNADLNQYIIYYNDFDTTKLNTKRYRWNIAHELGHVRLEHHKKYPDSKLYRNRLSKSTYKTLEAEADMFAAYILVPHILLSCLGVTADFEIAKWCQISDTAALYREEDLRLWRKRKKIVDYDYSILTCFSDYIEKENTSNQVRRWIASHRTCSFCGGASPVISQKFCSFCGVAIVPQYLDKGDFMRYSGIEIDEDGRAAECPVCHNTDVYKAGEFCVICGHRIINVCSESISRDQFGQQMCEHNEPLPGNARYCPWCGAKTSFFVSKFISSWNGISDEEDDFEKIPF